MSKIHTPQAEEQNFKEGQLVLVSDTPFFRTTPLPPILSILPFYGKILNTPHPFLGKFQKLNSPSHPTPLTLPPFIEGGAFQLWVVNTKRSFRTQIFKLPMSCCFFSSFSFSRLCPWTNCKIFLHIFEIVCQGACDQ